MCRSSAFHMGNEHAIFCNKHAHALFHILHAYLQLFWYSIDVYRCRFHTRYKSMSIPEPDTCACLNNFLLCFRNWGRWEGPDNDKYAAQKYENGQNCWNGPNRSVKVCVVRNSGYVTTTLAGRNFPFLCQCPPLHPV